MVHASFGADLAERSALPASFDDQPVTFGQVSPSLTRDQSQPGREDVTAARLRLVHNATC